LSPLVDVDYLVYELVRRRFPLDIEGLHGSPVRLLIQVTDAVTARPHHFDVATLSPEDFWAALVASAAIPGLYELPVTVAGSRFLDGGITDPIPLTLLLRGGAEAIIAVWTRPLTSENKRASVLYRSAMPIILRSQTAAVQSVLMARDPAYIEAMNLCIVGHDRVLSVAPRRADLIASRLDRTEEAFWRLLALATWSGRLSFLRAP
jgi:predicted patatin/cPLA2 family phospholipase